MASSASSECSFAFCGLEFLAESPEQYIKDKFHPVMLGQVLPLPGTCVDRPERQPSYRLWVKLAHGGFATVWLARDLTEKRRVVIKFCQGTEAFHRSREASILSKIRETGREQVGFKQIVQLFHDFTVRGPNGFHEFC